MGETEEKKKGWIRRVFPVFLLVAPLVGAGLVALLPAKACEGVVRCHWGLKGARVLDGNGPGTLLVHLHSKGRKRQRSLDKLLTVDLDKGAQLGEYLTKNWVKPFGVSQEHLWIRQGGVSARRWVGYALPGLAEAFDLDPEDKELAERAPPGADPEGSDALLWKHCEYPPKPPGSIDDELLLDGYFVCDGSTGGLLDLGDGDRLLFYQDLKQETGKMILGRLSTDGRWVWKFHERERFGKRALEAHGYRVAFAAKLPKLLLLVIEQDDAEGDIWVLALNPLDGRPLWSLQYE